MKKKVIKGTATAMVLFSICICIGGCGRFIRKFSDRFPDTRDEEEIYQQVVEDFFQAVDQRDKEAVKELFSLDIAKQNKEMDAEIERLFQFYPNPTDRWDIKNKCDGSYSTDHGKSTKLISNWFPVISNGKNYYCHMSYMYQDDTTPDNVGIRQLVFLSEKAECYEDLLWPEEKGLFVIEDVPGDYFTRRIGYYPTIYTTIDRTVTEMEILDFLDQSDDWLAFVEQFGQPNAETCARMVYAYELPDEDGEKRYAEIWVDLPPESENGKIFKVNIMNDTDLVALSTPWEKQKK